MKKELEAKLCKEFPMLFSDTSKNMKESLMCFGCECRDGWYELIRSASVELEPLVKEWIAENPMVAENYPRYVQIKEKFGTLCLYMTFGTDAMYEVTRKYEHMSATTCETCGANGPDVKRRGRGWIYTACLMCTKPEDFDNFEFIEDADDKKKGIK